MDTLGFLGPLGTHSEAAALHLNGLLDEPRELCAYPTIFQALLAVEEGQADGALVPVENSLEGSVNITLDALSAGDALTVTLELIWGVRNELMMKYPKEQVRRIISHAQPLSQCRDYLKAHHAAADLVAVSSTAEAARLVAESRPEDGCAAICTARAGELYGLYALAQDIQDTMANCTRFFLVERAGRNAPALRFAGEPAPEKLLVISQIDGKRAGSLCEVLQEFAVRGVNMLRIESRPVRTKLGAYTFFFELEADAAEPLAASIEAVREKSIWLRTLGTFPVLTAANLKGASLWSSL